MTEPASTMWIRAFVMCDDVRLEVGGTMTLVGVFADRIVLGAASSELAADSDVVLPRVAIYSVVAGLTGADELVFRLTLDGEPLSTGTEAHDPGFDEHRLISFVGPIKLPATGGRLALEVSAATRRAAVEHRVAFEHAAA